MSNINFHTIKRRIIDKSALKGTVATALTAVDDLPFTIKAGSQVGIVLDEASDQALVAALADGVVYELECAFYLLKVVATGAVAGNILLEHHSKAVVQKVDGKVYVNNCHAGAFTPNAFAVTTFTNTVVATAAKLTSF